MSRYLLPILAFSLVSCGDDAPGSGSSDPSQDLEQCEENGGFIIDTGASTGRCALATSDGGTPCSDGAECEGYCQAPWGTEKGATNVVGECSAHTEEMCHQEVNGGVAGRRLCI